jgi:hypothetical protein
MVLIVDFDAVEISPGDAGYRGETIVESIQKLRGVTSVNIAGRVMPREN